MQADRNTTNIRSFYSVTNNQRNALRRQQRTERSSTNFDSFTDVNCGVRF
ncbi:hypothetical protein T12_9361 [Trichinella patagoniensis]|uniref:Uncharacterized protein n=1 Tax=Trichinella patagoniensis TaxID=990121 RepID=A0A0V0YRU9_9BILA|nr:hypothetical protein T12_9361 [Trichinella patagoniensis]